MTDSDILDTFPDYLTMSFVYASTQMPKDRLQPLYYVCPLFLFNELLVFGYAIECGFAKTRCPQYIQNTLSLVRNDSLLWYD